MVCQPGYLTTVSLSLSLVGDDSHPAIMQHRMSSVSARICADIQIAKKKRKRKGRRRRREICLRLHTVLLVKLLCQSSPFLVIPHCLLLPSNSPDLYIWFLQLFHYFSSCSLNCFQFPSIFFFMEFRYLNCLPQFKLNYTGYYTTDRLSHWRHMMGYPQERLAL